LSKINLGDVFKIKTSEGFGYLHFVFLHKEKEMVKIFCNSKINDLNVSEFIVTSQDYFLIFFPVSAAFRKKIITKVGNVNTQNFAMPQYMRSVHTIRGAFLGWHIVDTTTLKLQLVKSLNAEQKKLSSWGTWNDTLLIEQLDIGWNLEMWNNDPYSL
jgi:hypothetical protein